MTRQGILPATEERRLGHVMHLCRMRRRAGGEFLVGFLLRVAHSLVATYPVVGPLVRRGISADEIKRLKGIWWMPWH